MLGLQHRLPLVVAGVYEAKNEVCARVDYFRYGINLQTETPSVEAIRAAVAEVLSNPQYRDNVGRLAEELTRFNANERCASYIGELLERNTSA